MRRGKAVTEEAYLKELSRLFRESSDAGVSSDVMAIVEQAVAAFPGSARLWCRRGDLIQLGSEDTAELYTLGDARTSYERALQLVPEHVEALESLGHFFDAVEPDPVAAEGYFVKAVERGASRPAFISLAELYLEQGRTAEAIALLGIERCPYHDDPEVAMVRRQAAGASKEDGGA
jgi:tetratricopeptide (TPR) repeat protein